MLWVKVPSVTLFLNIDHAVLRVYFILLQLHFKYCGEDYTKDFYITDRDLASNSHCSSFTIFKAKKILVQENLITFTRGPKNKTFYKILEIVT